MGQVKTYAGLQARKSDNPVVHRIALFNHQKFILFLSKGGGFVTATESRWNTPGTFIGSDASVLISEDFCLLFESLFDQKPSAAQIEAYKQCISVKRIDTEEWEAPCAL